MQFCGPFPLEIVIDTLECVQVRIPRIFDEFSNSLKTTLSWFLFGKAPSMGKLVRFEEMHSKDVDAKLLYS